MRDFIYAGLILTSFSLRAEDVVRYRVEKGDTLSGILFKLNIGPIYGPKGFRKLSANMNGLNWNGNNLKIGDELVFPASLVNKTPAEEIAPVVEAAPVVEVSPTENEIAPPVANDENPVPPRYEFVEVKDEPQAVIATPVAQVVTPAPVEEESDHPQHHSFVVSPQVSILNLTSESADAFQHSDLDIYTRPIPGVQLQYNLHWDEHWSFLIYANLSRISFYPDDEVVYNRTAVSKNGYGFGASLREGTSDWTGTLGLSDELFFSLPSTTQVKVQVVALPVIQISHRNSFKKKKKLSLKYGFNARAILPYETPEIKADLGYGGGLELLLGSARRNFRLFYNYAQANARDHETTSSEIGLGFIMEGHFYE